MGINYFNPSALTTLVYFVRVVSNTIQKAGSTRKAIPGIMHHDSESVNLQPTIYCMYQIRKNKIRKVHRVLSTCEKIRLLTVEFPFHYQSGLFIRYIWTIIMTINQNAKGIFVKIRSSFSLSFSNLIFSWGYGPSITSKVYLIPVHNVLLLLL